MKTRLLFTEIATILIMACAGCCGFATKTSETSLLSQAEKQFEQKEYALAQANYRRHMQQRLKERDRPEWENPHFYLLLIGDCYLHQGYIELALVDYQEALEQGVSQELVADRYRSVAKWYKEHGNLEKAFEFLQTHRHLDPLLFDVMLDRIAKAIVKREDDRR